MSRKWRVFYGDGSTFDDAEGGRAAEFLAVRWGCSPTVLAPFFVPRLDVQVITGPDPQVGRYMVAQKDYYWWDLQRDRWFGGDHNGERDHLIQIGPRVVLWGRYITNLEYAACVKSALDDPDFPVKNARLEEEVY